MTESVAEVGTAMESAEDFLAYVDENGNTGLNVGTPGCSRLFIVVAVLVRVTDYETVATRINEIRDQRMSGAELKSSRVGKNHKRRQELLQEMQGLPFSYFALVVDKARVKKDSGLQFKGSFYKYLNGMLYDYLYRSWQNMFVTADRIGGDEFITSFERYMDERFKSDLLVRIETTMADATDEPLIQLADFIAGTLSFIYDPERRGDHSEGFRALLHPHEIGVRGWPWASQNLLTAALPDVTEWDDVVRTMTMNAAEVFECEHEESGQEDRQMQVAVLRHLLFRSQFEEENDPVVSDRLIEYLEGQGFPELNRQALLSRVIGPLRDAGIMLAGGQQGYKLALSMDDMNVYLKHCDSIIVPMLARLRNARERVKLSTGNELDILPQAPWGALRHLADAFTEYERLRLEAAKLEGTGE